MTTQQEVKVPRSPHVHEYHGLLRDKVFPATDQLRAEGLIEASHFLSHNGSLDLRLSVRDDADRDRIGAVLVAHNLPGVMHDYVPAETGAARDHLVDVLTRGAEQVRAVVTAQDSPVDLSYVVHYLLNQWGFSDNDELRLYLYLALARVGPPPVIQPAPHI